MKFPISVLPATVCLKELFNHLCMLAITFVVLLLCGYYPNIYWLNLIYYAFCAFMLVESLSLVTSVLTMIWRDVKKLVVSLMRMLLYLSPVLWPAMLSDIPLMSIILKLNPIYYIITGYRDAVFFNKSFLAHPALTLYFWIVILVLFIIGSSLMYHFKRKMVDMI